jgi:hypothetical protein
MPSLLMEDFQIRDYLIRVFGNGLAPKRFLTPFKFRSSRRLRNSRRSDILAGPLRGLPSKNGM